MKILILLLLSPIMLFAQEKKIIRIIDGNTFETSAGEKVRIVGINPPGKNGLYGTEAKNHLQQLIGGKTVTLQADDVAPARDSLNVMLRYVYLNNTDIGERMMLDGYALPSSNYRYVKSSDYRQAQQLAQNLGFGMWHNPSNISKKDTSESSSAVVQNHLARFNFINNASLKTYVIGSAVLLLLFIGVYSYVKK